MALGVGNQCARNIRPTDNKGSVTNSLKFPIVDCLVVL
jgi:hypothetical protein